MVSRETEDNDKSSTQRWRWLEATLAERMGDPTKPSRRSKLNSKSKSSRKSSKSRSKASRSESSTPQTSATTTPASTPPRTTRAARRKAQEEEDLLNIENPPSYHYILVQRYPEEAKKAAQRQALERAALERAEAERAVQRAHRFRQRGGGDIHRHQMSWEEVEEYLKRKLSRSASVLSRHLGRVTSRSLESLSSGSNHSHNSFGSNSLADEEKFYYDDNDDDRSTGSQGSLGVLWNHMTCSGGETQAEDWIGIPPPLDESFDEGPASPVRASCSPFRQPPF